jgi:hypothetical protein
MAYLYRSAFPTFLLIAGAPVTGCGPLEPRVETFAIRAHSLDASRCAVDTNPDVTLQALGPFPVSNLATERLRFDTGQRTLAFPVEALGVDAVATDGESTWLGYTDRRTERGIDVLLWREGLGCELYGGGEPPPDPGSYPGPNGGQAMGYSPETGVLLVAGSDSTRGAAGGSLFFESDTGRSGLIEKLTFRQARAFATITPFGSQLLLAGGESPLDTDFVYDRVTLQSAAVYDAALGGFEADLMELEFARTRHAAVVMSGGETLLVGGGRTRGDGSMVLVTQFEVVSPETRRSTISGVVGLANGRLHPTALLLDNGNLLVGGGFDVNKQPVSSVEWFSSDGSCALSPSTNECTSDPPNVRLTPRHHRAFVALPGGGALTVGGCEPATEQTDICRTACGENFGCPATAPDASWIAPNGVVTPVEFERNEECDPFSPERVLLAPGSDGSPWLLAYDEDVNPSCRAVYRFNPWGENPTFEWIETGRFDPSPWPDPQTPLTSLGPDAFVWLTEGDPPLLVGTRAGVRGPLSQYESSLLNALSDDPQRPVHLAPDRPPEAAPEPQALFRGSRLILEFPDQPNEPVVTVHVTDTSYDDVLVSIGFSGQGPPVLVLGSYEVGGRDCDWPDSPVSPLLVVRRGREVTTSDDRGRTVTCSNAPTGRVTVAARVGETSTTLTSLVVQRR